MRMEDPVIVAVFCFIVLLGLLLINVWVAVALAMVAVLGFFVTQGNAGLVFLVPL